MSKKDLSLFINKVTQLKELVNSLDEVQGRKELLENCENHAEVVELAKSWGYDIGRRWGEPD